jgi:diguanylate cyclase (GGDEF)-like protein/PAS domain S-box-containing protein
VNALAIPDVATEYEALIQFVYLAPVGLAQTSSDGEIVFINPVSSQLLMPLSRDGQLSNLFTALENVAPDLRHLASSFPGSSGMICDALRIRLSAGTQLTAAPETLSLTLLKLDADRLMAVVSDVTLQVKRERLLRQNEAWINAILTGITDYAIVSLDRAGCVTDCSGGVSRVTGFRAEAVLGLPFSVFYPEDATTPDRVLDRLREADDSGWSLDDGWRIRADGTRYWGSAMIAPLHDRQGNGDEERSYCLIIRDITDKREASENQRREQSCDYLTGIANRRAFFDAAELELERAKRSPRPLSLILFDADHFKAINDRFGHPAGDEVLRHLADTLASTFRQIDVVARIGGEEFAVLLPSTAIEAAMAVAVRLQKLIETKGVLVEGHDIRYTVSGGIAAMGPEVNALADLMKRADQALYSAKANGRNRVEYWTAA